MSKEISKLLKRILDFEYYGWLTKEEVIILKNYIKSLQHQLEERDKAIKEIKNALTDYKSEWAENDQVIDDINEFLEILERGKNENTDN